MANIGITTRDVARELARRYSTMTHDELDMRVHGYGKQYCDVYREPFS